MQPFELTQLEITPAETDADLEPMIHVPGLVAPAGGLRLRRAEGVALALRRRGRARSAAARRWRGAARRPLGTRARALGKGALQGEVKESDTDSRTFLEHRGFVQVGAEKAVVLDLTAIEPPAVEPPAGVRIASRAEVPDRLEDMYAVAVQADEDIPGSVGVQTFEQWRAMEIDKPSRRPELCFLALAGDEVVGYAALHVFATRRSTASPRRGATGGGAEWRQRSSAPRSPPRGARASAAS